MALTTKPKWGPQPEIIANDKLNAMVDYTSDRVRFVGDWSNTTAYEKNDLVSYGGAKWLARIGSTNSAPAEGAAWTALGGGGSATVAPASTSALGIVKMSTAPADAANPIAVGDNDPRNSDARPPTGGAGGVLSGNYPNPGFATDMATQAELDSAVSTLNGALTNKASLVNGVVPTSQLPPSTIGESFTVNSQAAMLALTAQIGDVAIRTDLSNRKLLLLGADPSVLSNWQDFVSTGNVASVNGQTGAVVLGKGDIGLGNVENLAPADLPISSTTQSALNGKAPTAHNHDASAIVSGVVAPEHLGTGTRDNTTFLRGDGTFATPPSATGTNASQIQGVNVAATAPANGQALVYNASTTQYEPGTVASSGGGSGGDIRDAWLFN